MGKTVQARPWLKHPRGSDEAVSVSRKAVLEVHSHSGFICPWLSHWVWKVLNSLRRDCVLFIWVIQYRLLSYVSLIEWSFWKKLKVELLITPLGSPGFVKPVCVSLRGHGFWWSSAAGMVLRLVGILVLQDCFLRFGPWTHSIRSPENLWEMQMCRCQPRLMGD